MEEIPAREEEGDIMTDLFGDDDDDNEPEEGDTMADLFGSDVEEETAIDNQGEFMQMPPTAAGLPRKVMKRICPEGSNLPIRLPLSNHSGDDLTVVRVPNVVALEEENFDASNYEAPKQTTKSSFIRWRIIFDPNDPSQPFKESNSRLVTWSDGSKSLVVGKEYFDIEETPYDRKEEHFLFSKGKTLGPSKGERLLLGHGSISSKFHVKAMNQTGVVAEMSQSAVARKFLRMNKSRQISVGQKVAMLREQRARQGIHDAQSKANRKRKRQTQRQERAKRQKMTQEFLETGADEINPDDMNDSTDEEDFDQTNKAPGTRNQVTNRLANLVQADEPSSESEDEEPLTKLTSRRNNKQIIDDSEDSD